MRAVELFCGIGVSSLGLVRAGLDLVLGVDVNRKVIETFNSQDILPPVGVVGRVGEVPLPPGLDLLSGGPVCRAFSLGARLFGTQGKADPRNTFPVFVSEVERYRPRFILIENTFGLHQFAGYLDELMSVLTSLGYRAGVYDVDCYQFGVPQHRRRVVIFGNRIGAELPRFPFSGRLDGPETVGDCLYPPPPHDPWPLLIPLSRRALEYYLRDPRHVQKHPPLLPDRPATTVVSVYRKGVPYGVVLLDGKYYHAGPRLAARLQGMPDEYILSMMSKTAALEAVGNGFPPQIMEWFAKYVS